MQQKDGSIDRVFWYFDFFGAVDAGSFAYHLSAGDGICGSSAGMDLPTGTVFKKSSH